MRGSGRRSIWRLAVVVSLAAVATPPLSASSNEAGLAIVSATNAIPVTTTSGEYVDVPQMAAGILCQEGADLQVSFSAETSVLGGGGGRIFVRALVDGEPAAPSEVVLSNEEVTAARAFSFVAKGLRSGGHWVQMQWFVDAGHTGRLGSMTLSLKSAPASTVSGGLVTAVATTAIATGVGYSDMPNMAVSVTLLATSNLMITLSAEMIPSNNAGFIRPVIDGVPEPGVDAQFAHLGFGGVESHTFVKENLAPGVHDVRIQWGADPSGNVIAFDRTLCVYHCPQGTLERSLGVAAQPPGDFALNFSDWRDAPGLSETVFLGESANLEVRFSGDVDADALHIRALVDGQPAEPPSCYFTNLANSGVQSFTFSREGLPAGQHSVKIQLASSVGGSGVMTDTTLCASLVAQQVPDLTRPYSGVRPVVGRRRVLTILWDPHRPEHPAPAKTDIENLLFGPGYSLANYYAENSGGRLALQNEGVLGWFASDIQPGSTYWGPRDQEDLPEDRNFNGVLDEGEDLNGNGLPDEPDGILQPDEDLNHNGVLDYDLDGDGWATWHQRSWWEALRDADPSIDFSQYDDNHDGVISFDELVVVIVKPQNSAAGFVRPTASRQYPTLQPLVLDGVRIPEVAEVYPGTAAANLGLFAHELSHILTRSGDMYVDGDFYKPTKPGAYSVMDNATGHHDPFHKIRCGWLDPKVVQADGTYPLGAVANSGSGVHLLYDPCHGNDEYFLVENRSAIGASAAFANDGAPRYAGVPAALDGAAFIQTATGDKFSTREDLIEFQTSVPIDVYIAHDDRYLAKPDWLGDFSDTGMDLNIGVTRSSLFRKSFTPGEVVLGGNVEPGESNNNQMYTVIIDGLTSPSQISGLVSRGSGDAYQLSTGLSGPLHFDNLLPSEGVAVWHIIEDPAVHNALPVPPEVDPAKWLSAADDAGFARRAVQMVRPIYGASPTYDWELWQAGSLTGYDLTAMHHTVNPLALEWADGSPAGFSIRGFPAPSPAMAVQIDVRTGMFPQITHLGANTGRFYRYLENGLNPGSLAYLDRDNLYYTSIPSELECAAYIQTANGDKFSSGAQLLQFDASEAVTVWIAYDDRYTVRPSWMAGFIDSARDLTIGPLPFSLFVKTFSAGTITLGGNVQPGETANNSMYTVIFTDPLIEERNLYGECYVTWAQQHWNIGTIFAFGTTRPTDDPDGDGRDNLFEFGFGLSPTTYNRRDPLTMLRGATPNLVTLASGINPAAVPCVRYIVEDSDDLSTWRPYSVIDYPSWADPTDFSITIGGDPRQFFRMRVEPK